MINNLQEAENCMLCKKARCQKNCPINTPIPQVIQLYKNGEIEKAGEILFNNNPLSVICAIVCPHEKQCRGNCIRTCSFPFNRTRNFNRVPKQH